MSRPPKEQAPVRQVSNRRPQANPARSAPPQSQRRNTYANVAPKRDPFPYVMGGLIGALVVGLMLAVFLLANNNNNNRGAAPVSQQTNNPANDQTAPTTAPAAEAARMNMDEFKALYDDPAKRPIILDVRTKQIYDEGHIKGAMSFPEADVDVRQGELPKDKVIVAYCQ